MRTSLNEIKEIEAYLSDTLNTSDRLVFEARMLVNRKLRREVALQKRAYSLIQYHYRMRLKQKFHNLHQRLFHDPLHATLKEEVMNLFKPKC